MKYESSILKRLVDTYGVVGNPRYISEIIKEFIVRGKERFPELFTYQADWLAHIDEFGLNPTYTVSYTGQSIYAPNTLERPVKSAILKGQTLVNLVNDVTSNEVGNYNNSQCKINVIRNLQNETLTIIFNVTSLEIPDGADGILRIGGGWSGQIRHNPTLGINKVLYNYNQTSNSWLGVFSNSEAYNLGQRITISDVMVLEGDYTNIDISYFEGMQSVKMPVLTTVGKNQWIEQDFAKHNSNSSILTNTNNGFIVEHPNGISEFIKTYINLKKGTWTISFDFEKTDTSSAWVFLQKGDVYGENIAQHIRIQNGRCSITYTSSSDIENACFFFDLRHQGMATISNIQLEESSTATSYEPYKSNILTVNEDVELGSVGEVKDELNLLTGQLTQRTETRAYQEGDESNSEVITDMANTRYKLPKESIKTVDLTILDQNGQSVEHLKSFNGGTHVYTSSLDGSLVPSVDISVVTNLEETLKMCSLEGNTL